MGKVLLVIPPSPMINHSPSLAAAYLAASLLEAGHEVRVVDLGAPFGPDIDELGSLLNTWQPDLAGATLYTETACQTYEMLKPYLAEAHPRGRFAGSRS